MKRGGDYQREGKLKMKRGRELETDGDGTKRGGKRSGSSGLAGGGLESWRRERLGGDAESLRI